MNNNQKVRDMSMTKINWMTTDTYGPPIELSDQTPMSHPITTAINIKIPFV